MKTITLTTLYERNNTIIFVDKISYLLDTYTDGDGNYTTIYFSGCEPLVVAENYQEVLEKINSEGVI